MSSPVIRTSSDNRVFLLLAAAATVISGVISGLLALEPLAAAGAAGLVALTALLARAQRLDVYFLSSLGLILVGYAFLGRGFAYLGLPPVYIGEVVLGVGVLALLLNVHRWRIGFVEAMLLIFMIIGALATLPFLTVYGVDALRDAVVWGYALIALGVAWLFRREHLEHVIRWYGRLIIPFVLLAPVILGSSAILGFAFPQQPWSGVPIVDVKPGDIAVHLGGVAAFVFAGLWVKRSDLSSVAEGLLWVAWFGGFLVAAAWNRGGLVAATLAISVTLVFRPNKKVFVPLFLGALLVTAFALVDPKVEVSGHRNLSMDQLTANLASLVTSSERDSLQGTREWRLQWWNDIVDYTVRGEHFWTGKGFGINLARSDGYSRSSSGSLRSPHSSHMSVLARMGVPGAVFWTTLQVAFATVMIRGIYRARRLGDPKLTSTMIVIFAYWLAMIINSSFDVYIEGPQGGIWFWAVFGLGLATSRMQAAQEEPQREHHESSLTRSQRPGASLGVTAKAQRM